MAKHPNWSRRRLSIALCEVLNWRTASGQLKDMSARLLLNKLAERGRTAGSACALGARTLYSECGRRGLDPGSTWTLQPLEVIAVEPRTTQANAFVWHLGQHHYLGCGGAAGLRGAQAAWAQTRTSGRLPTKTR